MILKEAILHANDRSFTFASLIFPALLHKYLKLPGEYVKSCPTAVMTIDMRKMDMDWLMYVKADNETLFEDILIKLNSRLNLSEKKKLRILSTIGIIQKRPMGCTY